MRKLHHIGRRAGALDRRAQRIEMGRYVGEESIAAGVERDAVVLALEQGSADELLKAWMRRVSAGDESANESAADLSEPSRATCTKA